jgi:hypothetical protein
MQKKEGKSEEKKRRRVDVTIRERKEGRVRNQSHATLFSEYLFDLKKKKIFFNKHSCPNQQNRKKHRPHIV